MHYVICIEPVEGFHNQECLNAKIMLNIFLFYYIFFILEAVSWKLPKIWYLPTIYLCLNLWLNDNFWLQDFNKKRLASDDSSTPDYTVGIFQSIGFKEFHDYLLLGVQEQGCPLGNNFFKLWHLKFNCIECNQFLYFRPETFQRRQRSNDVSHPTVRQKTSEVDSPTIFEKWDRSAMSSSLWSKFQFLSMYRICMLMVNIYQANIFASISKT